MPTPNQAQDSRALELNSSRFSVGDAMHFWRPKRRKGGRRELDEPWCLAATPGGVPIGYTCAHFGSRKLDLLRDDSMFGPFCPGIAGRDVVLCDDGLCAPERLLQMASWLRRGLPARLDLWVGVGDKGLHDVLGDVVDEIRVEHVVLVMTPGMNVYAEPVPDEDAVYHYILDFRGGCGDIEREVAAERERNPSPPNEGRPWTDAEDGRLLALLRARTRLQDVAKTLGRTEWSVDLRATDLLQAAARGASIWRPGRHPGRQAREARGADTIGAGERTQRLR